MKCKRIHFRSTFPVSAEVLYAWHERPGAFARLSPPWQDVRVVEMPEKLEEGSRAVLEIHRGPLSKRWTAEHFDVQPGKLFRDRQVEGPFAAWTHTHRCEQRSPGVSILSDEIEYALPLSSIGGNLARRWADSQLDRLFYYRHQILGSDLQHYGAAQPGSGKTVLISGHTGLIGRRLVPLLRNLGFAVRGLTRTPQASWEYGWDYLTEKMDPAALKGVDAVVHLAGENIAGGRWTEHRQRLIRESRLKGTLFLASRLAACAPAPATFISISGAHFYRTDGTPSTENAAHGNGFLNTVCREWEAAANPARAAGIRVVHPRLGVVLSPEGGALAKMIPAFLAGGGGPIGSGQQHLPWVSIEDVLGVIASALLDLRYEGPVNVSAPEIMTQRAFASVLGRVLRRPAIVPLPAGVVRALFGRMGEETLLADLQIISEKLTHWEYHWRHPNLESALRLLLGRPNSEDVPCVAVES